MRSSKVMVRLAVVKVILLLDVTLAPVLSTTTDCPVDPTVTVAAVTLKALVALSVMLPLLIMAVAAAMPILLLPAVTVTSEPDAVTVVASMARELAWMVAAPVVRLLMFLADMWTPRSAMMVAAAVASISTSEVAVRVTPVCMLVMMLVVSEPSMVMGALRVTWSPLRAMEGESMVAWPLAKMRVEPGVVTCEAERCIRNRSG